MSPSGIKILGVEVGYKNHIIRARSKLRVGAVRNGVKFADEGEACSFRNSFRASARGWGNPRNITLFGPFRS